MLKPGGRLGLIWNRRDEDSSPIMAAMTELMTPWEEGTPRYKTSKWRDAFSDTRSDFDPLTKTTFTHSQKGARQMIIDRSLSVSFIAALPAAQKAEVAAKLNAMIDSFPVPAQKLPNGEPQYELPYITEIFVTKVRK